MQRSARVWLVCLTSFIFRRAFAQHKNVHRAYWHKRSGKLLVIIGTGQPPWPCSRGQSGETRGMNSKGLCQNSFTHFSRFEPLESRFQQDVICKREIRYCRFDSNWLLPLLCIFFVIQHLPRISGWKDKVNGSPLLTSETVSWPTWPYYFYCEY